MLEQKAVFCCFVAPHQARMEEAREAARNLPLREDQEVVVLSHHWIDPKAKMRTTPPSECVIRRYYGEYKKGSFKNKVEMFTTIAFYWPKLWEAIRLRLRDDVMRAKEIQRLLKKKVEAKKAKPKGKAKPKAKSKAKAKA